jgi:hypothetical protein
MLRVTEMDRRFETTLFTVWHFRWVASAVEDCIGARIILFANEIASAANSRRARKGSWDVCLCHKRPTNVMAV